MAQKKTVLSGIQPSGSPTLGNYVGALRNWSLLQQPAHDCFYCVANLHAITVRQDADSLRQRAMDTVALLLACGIDPKESTVFIQSHVKEHAELNWVLACNTYMGELNRMTQFKDKSAKHADNINAGLFTYPVLMAADILLYQSHLVPVGADQKQHLEITRDIAERFNKTYGPAFVIPDPYIPKAGARVMSLQDPTQKMSKSDPNPKASVSLLDTPDAILKKFKSAVTDSEAIVRYADGKDGINNLMAIYSCCTGLDYEAIEREFDGKGYGDFKVKVAEAVIEELRPVQENYKRFMADKEYLMQTAAAGAEKAARIANRTLTKAKKKVGLLLG